MSVCHDHGADGFGAVAMKYGTSCGDGGTEQRKQKLTSQLHAAAKVISIGVQPGLLSKQRFA